VSEEGLGEIESGGGGSGGDQRWRGRLRPVVERAEAVGTGGGRGGGDGQQWRRGDSVKERRRGRHVWIAGIERGLLWLLVSRRWQKGSAISFGQGIL
jgi:hypothetical protein